MSHLSHHLHRVGNAADQAREAASPFVEMFARVGYAAKGVVYCIVGALAVMAAVGAGGETTGGKGALSAIVDQPFGQVLLGIVALGLCGYALWQFIRAVEDPEHEGTDGKAIVKRIGFFISGVVHVSLVLFALHLLLGDAGSSEDGAQDATARAMSWPAGKWLVAFAGLCVAGFGVQQLIKAYKAKVTEMLDLSSLDHGARRTVVAVSRAGLAARGVVFLITGVFALIAGLRSDPTEAKGLADALEWVRDLPLGWIALAVVALGLIAYGVFMFVKARYRRVHA